MKRDDVIEKLARLLENNFDGDNGSWELNAEYALNFLEDSIGMLPPFSHDVFEKNWKRDRDPITCSGNEWDEE